MNLLAVSDAPEVFSPGGLLGIAPQIGAGDVMVMASFTAAQAGEIELRSVGAGAVDAISLLSGVQLADSHRCRTVANAERSGKLKPTLKGQQAACLVADGTEPKVVTALEAAATKVGAVFKIIAPNDPSGRSDPRWTFRVI
jgi:hypothetical protein